MLFNFYYLVPCAIRRFSINISYNKSSQQSLQSKFMMKLITSSKKKRKMFICETSPPTGSTLRMQEFRPSKENSRRVAVLNKLFIKSISDILATGNLKENVLEKGLEITRVAIEPGFAHLNVFWTCNNEQNMKVLEVVLPDLGYKIRHELSQLRLMGNVPRINFVIDKEISIALKVDQLLKIADYGEDHVALETASDFKESQISGTNIDNTQQNDENCDPEEQQLSVDALPLMRQDTFNLNHEAIMNKIMKSMHKSRALHRYEPNLAISSEGTKFNLEEITFDEMSKKQRKEAIASFILQRRLKLKRDHRYNNKYNTDLKGPSPETVEEDDIDDDLFLEEEEEEYFENK